MLKISQKWLCLFLVISLFVAQGCIGKKKPANKPVQLINHLNDALNNAIVYDGFSPPVASRIYAYTSIAAYESLRLNDTMPSLSGKLNGFQLNLPEIKGEINPRAVMVSAFCKVAVEMVYRDYFIDSVRVNCFNELKNESDEAVLKRSDELGLEIAGQILKWAAKDKYKETRSMPRYTPSGKDGHWEPTPPVYADALEPYWSMVRPFVMDSSTQFILQPPPAFGPTSAAPIYAEALKVKEAVSNSDSVQLLISEFWDCNPLRTYVKGHVMYNRRQLTPGGHWMSIARSACLKSQFDELHSARIYALTAIAVADGFIAAWEEKFRYDYIRPETYINKYIDKYWKPRIETPPFPEYPSAHSVISASGATVLTEIFGNGYSFADSAEIPFEKTLRNFYCFRDAANEAARSRVTAGIHFVPACENGKTLGNKVGNLVVTKLMKK